MTRIADAPGGGQVAARIRDRRPGGVLRPIDHVLLHCPPVADGWNELLGAIRGGMSLPAPVRELVILRIAVLNRAPYEWSSHEAEGLAAGLTPAQLAALARPDAASAPEFDDEQRLVIRYTDTITQAVDVPAELFSEVAARFDVQALVELSLTAAAYNMVSRLVVAFDIDISTDVPAPAPSRSAGAR